MAVLLNCYATTEDSLKEFYQIKIYHCINQEQVKTTEQYFEKVYIPALHKAGINHVGVFKPIDNDTAINKSLYVLLPFKSIEKWLQLDDLLLKNELYTTNATPYTAASADKPPYDRLESILIKSFRLHPQFNMPMLKAAKTERIYELRSYESPTEHLFERKVTMFNEGDEIGLFKRLNFNAIFYGDVISGCRMPNLMYMTSFENIEDREAHWKAFVEDEYWKKISNDPQYENKVSVSKADVILLHALPFSDF